MDREAITIPMDAELAEVYKTASTEDQQKIQALVSIWLREIATSDSHALSELMDTISDRAQARGLTPEILDELLEDD
jgi:hypothetical protein